MAYFGLQAKQAKGSHLSLEEAVTRVIRVAAAVSRFTIHAHFLRICPLGVVF